VKLVPTKRMMKGRIYTLKEFAKLSGLSESTLREYDDLLKPLRTPGGHRRYTDEHLAKLYRLQLIEPKTKDTIVYARVSTKAQEKDLQRQVDALLTFCSSKGWKVDEIITDIGSSVNFKRSGLLKLLQLIVYQRPKRVVIATRDRLARIGFDLFETLCNLVGTELIVVYDDLNADNYDPIKQVTEELVHIIQLYAMKLYGMRSYHKIKSCVLGQLKDDEKGQTNENN